MTEARPQISIIIPEYNAKDYLVQSILAFKKSEQKKFELIIVDDNSTDDSPEFAQQYADVVLKMEKNSGPGKARNRGVQASRASIILFLDADVRIYPDTISKVLAAFQENPEISAVFGSYFSFIKKMGLLSLSLRSFTIGFTYSTARSHLYCSQRSI